MPPDFLYGVCYYPEHWDPSRHPADIRRIAAAGFNLVRLGEGAWSYWEPGEGHYQFEMFDRVIDLCAQHRIRVLLGTPTYAAPAWVSHKYPDVLRQDFHRTPMAHGSRRNLNYTSPDYLRLSDALCTALAEHYRGRPEVIGWQLDNEFNCHMDVSYAPSDSAAFRDWLRERYGSLEELNRAWGTAFWSQTYDDWEQVDLPHPSATYLNPTRLLDETRFISDTVVRFAARQAAILRAANPRWLITHNGLFNNVKGPDLVRTLDFFSHDQYPLFHKEWTGPSAALVQARSLAEFSRPGTANEDGRSKMEDGSDGAPPSPAPSSILHPPSSSSPARAFAILEQQSGPGGQMDYLHRTPRPGEMRLWAWQSVAHGANALCYFRWRTCPYGSEQHWHGLLDADDRDNRRLREAQRVGEEVRKLPRDFFDTPPDAVAAVLRDFDNEANDRRINTYNKDGQWEAHRWAAELARRHVPVDMAWAESALVVPVPGAPAPNPPAAPSQLRPRWRLLVAPHLKLMPPPLVERLHEYVEAGGVLLLGAQSGSKDSNCHTIELPLPGLLADLAGVEVEDWTTLTAGETRTARLGSGAQLPLDTFVERLRLTAAQPVALWETDDTLLAGGVAIAVNHRGAGTVYTVGGYCPAPAVAALADWLLARHEIAPPVQAPPAVEVVSRGPFLVLLNHSPQSQQVTGLAPATDLLGGAAVQGDLSLAPFGVLPLRRPT